MEMMSQFNALEREVGDWERVLKRADPRLEIKSISKPPGSVMSVIEVVVGTDGLRETDQRKDTLTYGRRGSLLYAETENMGYKRQDSIPYATVAGRA